MAENSTCRKHGPITSWQIDGKTAEIDVFLELSGFFDDPADFGNLICGSSVFSKTNLNSISKSRDITLPTNDHLVKGMVFPVIMYGCESWTIKKAESQRFDAFELWCWRRS